MERKEDFLIPEEIVEWIGLKKSEYLSRLIMEQKSEDIGFEDFQHYDAYVPGTIEVPDRTYQFKEDDQRIRTYVKTYSEKILFHQVVIGILIEDKSNNSDVFVPIITFVSRDANLIKGFSLGDAVSKPVLN